jgi:hypothetical protein
MIKNVKIRTLAGSAVLAGTLLFSGVASVFASPARTDQSRPPTSSVSGVQAKPPVAPGSRDAKATAARGATRLTQTQADGSPTGSATLRAGVVANVDFQTPLNYCWRNLVYTPVRNTTTATKYIQVRLYSQGTYHDIYTSVAPNGSIAYPAFYGIDGAYSAYLYVWNGSYYQYDEYRGGTNTCNVSVTRTYNTGGWVQLKIQNLGTAYATQQSSELAPFPGSGTYTGTHYDYPAAGGAALYRWFWVSTSPYGIVSDTLGSFNSPYYFSGDL